MDEFEALKQRARSLKATIPSQKGCLKALDDEGTTGPMAQAAVEAVFNEEKDAVKARRQADEETEREERPKRVASSGSAIVDLLFLAVGAVGGTFLAGVFTPKVEILSPLHFFWMLGVVGLLKVLQSAKHRLF